MTPSLGANVDIDKANSTSKATAAGKGLNVRLWTLVTTIPWAEVEGTLLRLFPHRRPTFSKLESAYAGFASLPHEPNPMRISIEEFEIPGADIVPPLHVVGRNGTLWREIPYADAPGLESNTSDEEAVLSLSGYPWRQWMGMTVEPFTLHRLDSAEIIARILIAMTHLGFTDSERAETIASIHRWADMAQNGSSGGLH